MDRKRHAELSRSLPPISKGAFEVSTEPQSFFCSPLTQQSGFRLPSKPIPLLKRGDELEEPGKES